MAWEDSRFDRRCVKNGAALNNLYQLLQAVFAYGRQEQPVNFDETLLTPVYDIALEALAKRSVLSNSANYEAWKESLNQAAAPVEALAASEEGGHDRRIRATINADYAKALRALALVPSNHLHRLRGIMSSDEIYDLAGMVVSAVRFRNMSLAQYDYTTKQLLNALRSTDQNPYVGYDEPPQIQR